MPPHDKTDDEPKPKGKPGTGKHSPEWADGLRHLYDAVVDEPLPDSFKDLLDQLDQSDAAPSSDEGKAG